MADGHASGDLAKKLDEDLDKHMEKMLLKNEGYKYEDGLTEENLEEQLQKIPAFMEGTPTQEQIDDSPALQAMQALKYETENPHACALSHKEDGNYHFGKKKYKVAIQAYTEGLKQQHGDDTLTAVLYTNRAAAHFYLGNNRTALSDATWAVKHKSTHMKAYVRAAISCFDLERYDECVNWCNEGLNVDGKEKRLIELKKKSVHQKKQMERDARKKQLKELKDLTERNQLIDEIESRHIRIECSGGEVTYSKEGVHHLLHKTTQPHSGKLHMDTHRNLYWPMYFLYPEFNQSDFVEDMLETLSFKDQLSIVFENPADWDAKKDYVVDKIQVFFEDRSTQRLVHVPLETTIRQVLSDSRYVVRATCPSFIVLSSSSAYFETTFQNGPPQEF